MIRGSPYDPRFTIHGQGGGCTLRKQVVSLYGAQARDINHRQVYLVLRQSLKNQKKGSTDKKFAKEVQRQRKKGFGWRYDGLGDWTTEAIFEKLYELGIDTGAERFLEQARAAGRCMALDENWRVDRELDDSLWEDFPFLASEELWGRLTPELICPEIISDHLEEAIERDLNRKSPLPLEEKQADIDLGLQVVDYLEGFNYFKRSISDDHTS